MIAWTIYLTFAGAVVLLIFPGVAARWIALLTAVVGLILGIVALVCTPVADLAHFMTIVSVPWVPPLGMNYHLAVDGVSLTMVLVTGISAVSTVLFSWDVDQRQRDRGAQPRDAAADDHEIVLLHFNAVAAALCRRVRDVALAPRHSGAATARLFFSGWTLDVLIDQDRVSVGVHQHQRGRAGGGFLGFGSEGEAFSFEVFLNLANTGFKL